MICPCIYLRCARAELDKPEQYTHTKNCTRERDKLTDDGEMHSMDRAFNQTALTVNVLNCVWSDGILSTEIVFACFQKCAIYSNNFYYFFLDPKKKLNKNSYLRE